MKTLDFDDKRIAEGFDLEPQRFGCEKFHKAMGRCHFKGGDNSIEETAEEKELATIAKEKFELYQKELAPLEDEYMSRVDDLKTEPARKFARGVASQNTEKSYARLGDQVKEQEINAGVDPNSGRLKSRLAGVHQAKAGASGENMVLADNAQEDDYVTGMSNINAMGQGQATNAQGGFSRLASVSASKAADDAETDWNNRTNRLNVAGSAAGAGAYYYNK